MAADDTYKKALSKLRDGLSAAQDAYDFANDPADKTRANRAARAIQGEIDQIIQEELADSSKAYEPLSDDIKNAQADLQKLKDDVDGFVASVNKLKSIVDGLNGVLRLLGSIL